MEMMKMEMNLSPGWMIKMALRWRKMNISARERYTDVFKMWVNPLSMVSRASFCLRHVRGKMLRPPPRTWIG